MAPQAFRRRVLLTTWNVVAVAAQAWYAPVGIGVVAWAGTEGAHSDQTIASETESLALSQGIWLFRKGQYAAAETKFRSAVEESPNHEQAYLWLARTQLRLHRPEEAAKTLQAALRRLPQSVELTYLLGTVEETLGRKDQAVACYERIAQQHVGAHSALAALRARDLPQAAPDQASGIPAVNPRQPQAATSPETAPSWLGPALLAVGILLILLMGVWSLRPWPLGETTRLQMPRGNPAPAGRRQNAFAPSHSDAKTDQQAEAGDSAAPEGKEPSETPTFSPAVDGTTGGVLPTPLGESSAELQKTPTASGPAAERHAAQPATPTSPKQPIVPHPPERHPHAGLPQPAADQPAREIESSQMPGPTPSEAKLHRPGPMREGKSTIDTLPLLRDPALSPDGRSIVFATPTALCLLNCDELDGPRILHFLRAKIRSHGEPPIPELEAERLVVLRRGVCSRPVWSPDGSWIAFEEQKDFEEQEEPAWLGKERHTAGLVGLVRPDGSDYRVVSPRESFCGSPTWMSANSLLFVRSTGGPSIWLWNPWSDKDELLVYDLANQRLRTRKTRIPLPNYNRVEWLSIARVLAFTADGYAGPFGYGYLPCFPLSADESERSRRASCLRIVKNVDRRVHRAGKILPFRSPALAIRGVAAIAASSRATIRAAPDASKVVVVHFFTQFGPWTCIRLRDMAAVGCIPRSGSRLVSLHEPGDAEEFQTLYRARSPAWSADGKQLAVVCDRGNVQPISPTVVHRPDELKILSYWEDGKKRKVRKQKGPDELKIPSWEDFGFESLVITDFEFKHPRVLLWATAIQSL